MAIFGNIMATCGKHGLNYNLGEDGFTSLFYVKEGANSKKCSLIGGTRYKMDISATLWPNVAKFVLVTLKIQWQFLATLTLWPLVKHGLN